MLSGVQQGTVLGPFLFMIMISDIDKDVSASKLVSFADDTRLYSSVRDVTCDNLQLDLNAFYNWVIIIITTLFAILFLSANQRCNFSTQQLL